MTLIKERHPSGRYLVFDESKHQYWMEDDPKTKFISVTRFISQFFDEFDTDTIAENYAIRNSLEKNDVLKDWENKKNIGIRLGNRCHEYAYNYITTGSGLLEPEIPKEKILFASIEYFIDILQEEEYDVISAESIICSPSLGIAGTLDLLYKPKSGKPFLFLGDWKTNKEIKFSDYKYAKNPIDYIEDCTLSKYKLQLNLYRYILQTEGYVDKSLQIIMQLQHLTVDGLKIIPIEDMTYPITDMLKCWKKNRKSFFKKDEKSS